MWVLGRLIGFREERIMTGECDYVRCGPKWTGGKQCKALHLCKTRD